MVKYSTVSNQVSAYGYVNGIYTNNSNNLKLFKNKIQNNNGHGVEGYSSSIIFCDDSYAGILNCNSGNNLITGNVIGVSAQYLSNFNLLDYLNVHYNNISGNTINAKATSNSYIESITNYWGGNPPTGIVTDATSRFVSGNNLPCIPGPPFKVGIVEEDNGISIKPSFKTAVHDVVSSDIMEELRRARGLAYSEKYNEAMDICKTILINADEDLYIAQTFVLIKEIYITTQDNDILEFLKHYERDGEKNPFAMMTYANALMATSYDYIIGDALPMYEEIVKTFPGTIHEIQALIQIANIHYFTRKDVIMAGEILIKLEKITAEDNIQIRQLRLLVERSLSVSFENGYTAQDVLRRVSLLISHKKYNEAFELAKTIILNTDEQFYIGQTFLCIQTIYGLTRSQDVLEFAMDYAKNGGKDPFAMQMYANMIMSTYDHTHKDLIDEALAIYKEIVELFPGTVHETAALYQIQGNNMARGLPFRFDIGGVILQNGKPLEGIDVTLSKTGVLGGDSVIYTTGKDGGYSFPNVMQRFRCNVSFQIEGNIYDTSFVLLQDTKDKIVNFNIINAVMGINDAEDIPTVYTLSQNYPNPFNPSTVIQYNIPKDEFVKLTVYDINGKVVKELVKGYKSAGRYNVEFNASGYSSGTYYYKLEAGEYKSMQKMMLVK